MKLGLAKRFGITREEKEGVEKVNNFLFNKVSELMSKRLISQYKMSLDIFDDFIEASQAEVKRVNSFKRDSPKKIKLEF